MSEALIPVSALKEPDDLLRIVYLPLPGLSDKFLKGNAKLHDMGTQWESIKRYGFRDPMALDVNLNGGQGAIVEGNGRLECLLWAYNEKQEPPRGIKIDADGVWHAPVVIGVDAFSEAEAQAYSITHNSGVLWGGSFTALDTSRLYDPEQYMEMLQHLEETESLPVGMDEDDYETLVRVLNPPEDDGDFDDESGSGGTGSGFQTPTQFQEFNADTVETTHCCPKCGHRWSESG